MTVSMRKMSAGEGYKYLLRSVVSGDGNRSLSTPLTRYYAEAGTPPGVWMGSGVTEFGAGQVTVGSMVSEPQLVLLIGQGRDPITGEQLGSAYQRFATHQERVDERAASLNPHLSDEERAQLVDEIEAEEMAKGSQTATAGFDYTFSVPKSVSVLWGVADAGSQALIVDAHHQAVAEVLAMLEREVAVTRAGANARDGASAHHDVVGVAATAYDHWDSRAGDPQLHTHVVVSNKVRTVFDGRWRSLDSRPMFASVVALSEHYNAVLADILRRSFGLEWEMRERGANRNPAFEIAGVGEELVAEFSNRSRAIEIEKNRLVEQYERDHGRAPDAATVIKLRATATLTTRPEKHVHSLAELTDSWRTRANRVLGGDATRWARALLARGARGDSVELARGLLRAGDVSPVAITEVARATVGAVSQKRSTWKHWNLWAEASRQTMEWRFATVADREQVVGRIVEEAKRISISLTPPELAYSPGVFRRNDGTSLFRPKHSVTFTSDEILAAEDRLLARGANRSSPVVDLEVIEAVSENEVLGHLLTDEQVATLTSIAVSGRQVDLLIGPAGAGKTTAMRALHAAWTRVHGKDSVVGLAPSAAAADVLAQDLGVACDNTAKWLHEQDRGRATFRKGQLVIIDEATLAGTLTLDRLTGLAADAGAKVLLVGDWAQLQSVDAGGAFPLLAEARDDTPELTEVHRFANKWEKDASVDLRLGRTKVISTYFRHERVKDGTHAEMVDAAYLAWRADLRAGRSSLLVTESTDAMVELNERARAERLRDGETLPSREVELHDGTRASIGDLIITRQNHRRIHALRGGWVKNGDRWRVTDVNDRRIGRGPTARDETGRLRRATGRLRRRARRPRIRHHRPPRPGDDGRHRARRRDRLDHQGELLRRHDTRTRVQHRVRRPRPPRRFPRGAVARGGHCEDDPVRSAPAFRRRALRPPDDQGGAGALVVLRADRRRVPHHRGRRSARPLGRRALGSGPVGRADRRRDRVGVVRAARRRASPRRVEWRRHLRCAAQGGRAAWVRRRPGHRRRPHQPRPPRHIGPVERRSTPAEPDRRPRPGRRRADVEQDASSPYRASGPARVTGDRARRGGCGRASGLGPPTRRTTRRLSAARPLGAGGSSGRRLPRPMAGR